MLVRVVSDVPKLPPMTLEGRRSPFREVLSEAASDTLSGLIHLLGDAVSAARGLAPRVGEPGISHALLVLALVACAVSLARALKAEAPLRVPRRRITPRPTPGPSRARGPRPRGGDAPDTHP